MDPVLIGEALPEGNYCDVCDAPATLTARDLYEVGSEGSFRRFVDGNLRRGCELHRPRAVWHLMDGSVIEVGEA